MEGVSAGGSTQVNEAACRALVKTFPRLIIVGTGGYFENSAEIVGSINESGVDLFFVAMGPPRQEFWISENMPRLKPSFCMGVGGNLDVISGAPQRAPMLFRKKAGS